MAVCLVGLFAATARAELRFEEPSVNLGEVWTGRPLAQQFGFVNNGLETIEITDLKASCGCLTPRLGKQVFRSGERGSVVLEVHTLSESVGPHTWTMRVHYRDRGAERVVPLQVSALLREEIVVQPAGVAIFTSGPASHEIVVTDLRFKALVVKGLHCSSPALSARVKRKYRDEQGHAACRIGLEVTDRFPEGRHEESVAIVTDDPAYPELRVRVTVHKTSARRVIVWPERLTWSRQGGEALPSQMVRLRSGQDEPVVVERVAAGDPALTCRWASGPGAMATLKISVDPRRLGKGSMQSAVQVYISKPVPSVVTIPVTVTGP
jgi:hypothetical protein